MHRTARGVFSDPWQSSHVAMRWTPNRIGNLKSCSGGGVLGGDAACRGDATLEKLVSGLRTAPETTGTHAIGRWQRLQSRGNGCVVAVPMCTG